jgi:CheY-like chemotaxis protein
MDIHMPVMDGPTAARSLRERGYAAPIWALTANAMKGYEREIQAHGFDGHFTKPIEIDRLLQGLADLLGGQRVDHAEPAIADVLPAPSPGPREPADPPSQALPMLELALQAPIASRLAHHPRLARIARSFCEQLPPKLEAMSVALAAQDWDELKSLAHWLKGAGGSVGYDPLFEPSRDLEHAAFEQRTDLAAQHLATLQTLQRRLVPPAQLVAPTTERPRAEVATP